MIHSVNEGGDSTPKATNLEPLPIDIEAYSPSKRTGSSLYMTDEGQLDRMENVLEREPTEMRNTPHTAYVRWMESLDDDLNPHMLEVLSEHHDEDSSILFQAVDELQHPVVRKAVREAARSRLRRLGMGNVYDVSRFGPLMSITILTRAFQTVKRVSKLTRELRRSAYVTVSVDIDFLTIPTREGVSWWRNL